MYLVILKTTSSVTCFKPCLGSHCPIAKFSIVEQELKSHTNILHSSQSFFWDNSSTPANHV
jgi:hypothetical protein